MSPNESTVSTLNDIFKRKIELDTFLGIKSGGIGNLISE